MRRTLLGILALSFLLTAGGLFFLGFASEYTLVLSASLRMGLVLGALWLAFDQVHEIVRRTPPWVMGGIALGMIVVVVRPRAILAMAPLLAGAAALHWFGRFLKPTPTSKKKPPDRRAS